MKRKELEMRILSMSLGCLMAVTSVPTVAFAAENVEEFVNVVTEDSTDIEVLEAEAADDYTYEEEVEVIDVVEEKENSEAAEIVEDENFEEISDTAEIFNEIERDTDAVAGISLQESKEADTVTGNYNGLSWSLDMSTGALTISGKGTMKDFSYGPNGNVQWRAHLSNIKSVTIEEGVTSIGSRAFHSATNLTSLTLPEGLTSIGSSAFYGCKLEEIVFPDSLTTIDSSAFQDMNTLKTIVLPAGINIKDPSSLRTKSLETVYFKGTFEQWEALLYKPNGSEYNVVFNYGRKDIATIETQPESCSFTENEDATKALFVTISKPDNVTKVEFAWYVNTSRAYSKDNKITSGISTSEDGLTSYCTVDTTNVGEKYYYCVITSTLADGSIVDSYSNIAKVEVAEKTIWKGKGTSDEPFQLSSTEDVQNLYTYVADGKSTDGKYFELTTDITLPANWTPIGTEANRFQGKIDGNNYTLTVPEGGKPLLGYVQNTEVRNLKIYGTRIAGYGLIDNFVGIDINGNVVIDNVTLKSGTQTLKSGLLGTYETTNSFAGCSSSGSYYYYATISNCTIEKDVVIGYDGTQSMIGSIAGRFNGTIKNCVSYATVKGVDYVGGLVGSKDHATYANSVEDSSFHGKVEAKGSCAGGIIGGGYEGFTESTLKTAPNGLRPSIKNCTVDGSIKGKECVGGIIGGDKYIAQSWGNVTYSITGNRFTGTLSGSKYVGGIIGYYNSLNKYDAISDNAFSATCGATEGIGYVKYLDTNVENPTTTSGMVVFNTANGTDACPDVKGCGWLANHNRSDDPLGKDKESLCKKIASAEVYVTIGNQGVLATANDDTIMAKKAVTVTDLNQDGKLSYDEALIAAHVAWFDAGADGYVTTSSDSGAYITKLWGTANGGYLTFNNNVALSSSVDTSYVEEGDQLYAVIMTDGSLYSDYYTYFDTDTKKVEAGKSFTLTLHGFMGMEYGDAPTPKAISDVSIGTWNNGRFTAIDDMKTDEHGKVSLSFASPGTYYVTANGVVSGVTTYNNSVVDAPIMAPVCVVTVTKATSNAPSIDNSAKDDMDKDDTPVETPDDKEDAVQHDYHISYQGSATYTGSAITPSVTVKDGSRVLVEGVDYSVSYKNNVNAGTAQIIIKGKGGYELEETKNFVIHACSLSDASIQVSDIYSEKTVKNPVPVITRDGKKLSNGKDFTLTYENGGVYSKSGKIIVTGKGNYTGSISVAVTVVDAKTTNLMSKVSVSNVKNFTYGEAYEQHPTVKFGKVILEKGKDYEISYENTEQAGTATMVLTGKGDYVGEKRVNFKITGTSIRKVKVSGLDKVVNYTGSEIKANYTLTLNGTTLKEGTDYTVSYGKNVSAGKASITFTGMGAYTDSVKKSFTIGKCSLETANVSLATNVAYTKGGAKPRVTLTVDGMTLREKSDYTVSYKNNKKVGATATVTITGKGSFAGKLVKTFTVGKQNLSNVKISADDLYVKNGKIKKFQSKVVLTDVDGKKLSAGKDYDKNIIYKDANGTILKNSKGLKVGDTITVTVTGKGAYEGSATTTYKILNK